MFFAPLESPVSQLSNEGKDVENGAESISRYDTVLSTISVPIPPFFLSPFCVWKDPGFVLKNPGYSVAFTMVWGGQVPAAAARKDPAGLRDGDGGGNLGLVDDTKGQRKESRNEIIQLPPF